MQNRPVDTNSSVIIKRRKAFGYATRYQLSRDDRIAFAEMLLWRDVTSWNDLTEPELVRLLDALEGFFLITHLRAQANKANTASAQSAVSGMFSI